MKLHLTAKVPNEGARLLAQWIMDRHGGDVECAAQPMLIDATTLQRVVEGDILPGSIIRASIWRATRLHLLFAAPARAGWFDAADAAPLAEAA